MEEHIWKGLWWEICIGFVKRYPQRTESEFQVSVTLNFIMKSNMRQHYNDRAIYHQTRRHLLCPKCVGARVGSSLYRAERTLPVSVAVPDLKSSASGELRGNRNDGCGQARRIKKADIEGQTQRWRRRVK